MLNLLIVCKYLFHEYCTFDLIYFQPPETPSVLKVLQNTSIQQWNSGKVLADCLNLLADVDDLQTAVCILIALGERRNDLPIDESVHVSSVYDIFQINMNLNTFWFNYLIFLMTFHFK